MPSIFSKNHKGIVWPNKMAEIKVAADFSNLVQKIEWTCPVEYVDANMASSYSLTCL